MLGTRWTLLICATLAGCGPGGELSTRPNSIAWGQIDFAETMPTGGYGEQELSLVNVGSGDLVVTLTDFDFDHLCVIGWEKGQLPVEIPVIEPDQTYTLFISVCDYFPEAGERDTEVSGTFEFETDGVEAAASVSWTFTPMLGIDTGD